MPSLDSRKVYKMYVVSEKQNKRGKFRLVPFDNDVFNKETDESEIADTLFGFADTLYDKDEKTRCLEIIDDMRNAGTVRFKFKDDERVFIPDIIDKIDLGQGSFRFYLVINTTHKEYKWVVGVLLGTAYYG